MNFFGNVLWLIFGGLITGAGYMLGGLLMCLTIIGIPFGVQSIKLGFAMLMPFGREVEGKERPTGLLGVIMTIVWVVLFGWEIALAHLLHALVMAITIVGLPFARQHLKMVVLALFPFGHDLR
jgi:uncharacterized membrane protein YccF (DUF307 family)